MHERETINYVKGEKRIADLFGYFNNLITLSFSLRRSPDTPLIIYAGDPREFTTSFVFLQEKSQCFFYLISNLFISNVYDYRNSNY